MLIAAVGHLYAFPYKEYAGANIGGSRGFPGSLAHAIKLNDFYRDTVHQVNLALCANFLLKTIVLDMNPVLMMMVTVVLLLQFAPTYHDYVLYNHNEGDEGRRKFRSRTFVPTDPEMDAVRKNKHMLGNKLDDIQLSSLSSSCTSNPKQSSTAQDSQNPETCLPCYPPILTTCRTTCLSSTWTCPATLQRFLQQMQVGQGDKKHKKSG